jgi:hypothetical protein
VRGSSSVRFLLERLKGLNGLNGGLNGLQ